MPVSTVVVLDTVTPVPVLVVEVVVVESGAISRSEGNHALVVTLVGVGVLVLVLSISEVVSSGVSLEVEVLVEFPGAGSEVTTPTLVVADVGSSDVVPE